MKIRHYAIINNHKSQNIDWDLMRDDPNMHGFHIPFTKGEYLKLANDLSEKSYYKDILEYCEKHGINNILSLGAGRAILEYGIKVNSNLKVTITDTSKSINRIRSFNIFDDAIQADYLRGDNFTVQPKTLVILSRIDTEFDDQDFENLFKKLSDNQALHVLFIPAELLGLKIFLVEMKVRIQSLLTGKKKVFCGFARTFSEFKKIWGAYFHINKVDIKKQLFFLKRKLVLLFYLTCDEYGFLYFC